MLKPNSEDTFESVKHFRGNDGDLVRQSFRKCATNFQNSGRPGNCMHFTARNILITSRPRTSHLWARLYPNPLFASFQTISIVRIELDRFSIRPGPGTDRRERSRDQKLRTICIFLSNSELILRVESGRFSQRLQPGKDITGLSRLIQTLMDFQGENVRECDERNNMQESGKFEQEFNLGSS